MQAKNPQTHKKTQNSPTTRKQTICGLDLAQGLSVCYLCFKLYILHILQLKKSQYVRHTPEDLDDGKSCKVNNL